MLDTTLDTNPTHARRTRGAQATRVHCCSCPGLGPNEPGLCTRGGPTHRGVRLPHVPTTAAECLFRLPQLHRFRWNVAAIVADRLIQSGALDAATASGAYAAALEELGSTSTFNMRAVWDFVRLVVPQLQTIPDDSLTALLGAAKKHLSQLQRIEAVRAHGRYGLLEREIKYGGEFLFNKFRAKFLCAICSVFLRICTATH